MQIFHLICILFIALAVHLVRGSSADNVDTIAIPVVDLNDISQTHNDIAKACESVGIFRPIGHGIHQDIMDSAFSAHRRLFSLPDSEKLSVPVQRGGFTRGYIPLGSESGSARKLECKDAFSYGFDWSSSPKIDFENALQGHNVWPRAVSNQTRHQLAIWFNESARVSRLVASGLSFALGLNRTSIDDLCDGGETISLMRLFRYFSEFHPSCQSGAASTVERIGSSPHTDWGFLTFILGDGGEGLQVLGDDGVWRELEPNARTGPIIICGDYLKLLTSSRFKSPIHRVVLPKWQSKRSSFVFFHYPNFRANFNINSRLHTKNRSNQDTQEVVLTEDSSLEIGISETRDDDVNTMLDLALSDPTLLEIPFGEYILQKWSEVMRKPPET